MDEREVACPAALARDVELDPNRTDSPGVAVTESASRFGVTRRPAPADRTCDVPVSYRDREDMGFLVRGRLDLKKRWQWKN